MDICEVKKWHCLFEQSGTFKRQFIDLGFSAFDYDILDDYGETDYKIDLFEEINKAYEGGGFNIFKDGKGGCSYCLFSLRSVFPPVYLAHDGKRETIQRKGGNREGGKFHQVPRRIRKLCAIDNQISNHLHKKRPSSSDRESLFERSLSNALLAFSPWFHRSEPEGLGGLLRETYSILLFQF